MGIGGSIFLLAVGAILAFATTITLNGLDLQVVGWILMAAGALGIVLFLTVFGPRRSTTTREATVYRDGTYPPVPPAAPGERETYRRDTY